MSFLAIFTARHHLQISSSLDTVINYTCQALKA